MASAAIVAIQSEPLHLAFLRGLSGSAVMIEAGGPDLSRNQIHIVICKAAAPHGI